MKKIPLNKGLVTLIDDSDYLSVAEFNWFATKIGRNLYVQRNTQKPDGSKSRQYLHRFLLSEPEGDVLHWDGNGLNNQRDNLRSASRKENLWSFQRKRVGASSRYRGVSWDASRNKWQSRLKKEYKTIHLGRFESEEAAARAYDTAAKQFYGEFSTSNFP